MEQPPMGQNNESVPQQNDGPAQNEPLTRKQQRDVRRQEKLAARARNAKSQSRQKLIVVSIIILGVIGMGWLLAVVGKNGGKVSGSVDTIADPRRGKSDATVVVKEYSDFQCPACKAAEPLVDQLVTQYGDRVRFEYNDFPLRSIHKNSEKAAVAANCADQQGKYWEYHAMLFDKQQDWESLTGDNFTNALVAYGEQLLLNTEQLRTCITSNTTLESINEDVREATQKDVRSTPTFFVGSERIVGADQAGLTSAIEKALNP